MRKFTIATFAFLFSGIVAVQAQNEDYTHVFSAGAGYSLTGSVVKKAFTLLELSSEVETSVTPALQLTYDHGFNNWFSVGLAGSIQSMQFNYDGDFTYDSDGDDELDSTVTGVWDLSTNRYNVALRLLFHYGNDGEMDLYSGVRPGMTGWLSSFSSDVEGVESEDVSDTFNGSRVSFAIIPIGIRGYLNDYIGLNFELNFGSPYLAYGGICFRM